MRRAYALCSLALIAASILLLGATCPDNSRARVGAMLQKGRPNPFVGLWVGLSEDATNVYNHAIIHSFRGKSDCQPDCPKVDVWKYRYKSLESERPIATQRPHWKTQFEARIISTILFGSQRRYLDGLRFFIQSNDSLKKL